MHIKKVCWRILPITIVIVLLTGASAASRLLLSKRDQHLIKIAFMNGSIAMLSMDLKEIQALKTDEELYREFVEAAANRYVRRVDVLSRPGNGLTRNAGGSRYLSPY